MSDGSANITFDRATLTIGGRTVELNGGTISAATSPRDSGQPWTDATKVVGGVLTGRMLEGDVRRTANDIIGALDDNGLRISNRAWLADTVRKAQQHDAVAAINDGLGDEVLRLAETVEAQASVMADMRKHPERHGIDWPTIDDGKTAAEWHAIADLANARVDRLEAGNAELQEQRDKALTLVRDRDDELAQANRFRVEDHERMAERVRNLSTLVDQVAAQRDEARAAADTLLADRPTVERRVRFVGGPLDDLELEAADVPALSPWLIDGTTEQPPRAAVTRWPDTIAIEGTPSTVKVNVSWLPGIEDVMITERHLMRYVFAGNGISMASSGVVDVATYRLDATGAALPGTEQGADRG